MKSPKHSIEMIEVWSNTEFDEERWPHVNGFDPDAIDEWTESWAQAARLMAIVGSAGHRDIAFTAKMNLKTGIALGWRLRPDRGGRGTGAVRAVPVALRGGAPPQRA
jgi:hypothetical protein